MRTGEFLTALEVLHLDGKWYKLTRNLVYYSELTRHTLTVPAGFVTDFASVPRLPIAYWLYGGRSNAAAVVHDCLYRWPFENRLTADRIFNEAMQAKGKKLIVRWPMTAAVMLFGWINYNPQPGCLDNRECKDSSKKCNSCSHYLHEWQETYKPGYWPPLEET